MSCGGCGFRCGCEIGDRGEGCCRVFFSFGGTCGLLFGLWGCWCWLLLGFGRQEARIPEDEFGGDGEAAALADVFCDGDGEEEGVFRTTLALFPPFLLFILCDGSRFFCSIGLILPRLKRKPPRPYSTPLHKMRNNIQPLAIPTQHARPHLKPHPDPNLPPKRTTHPPQINAQPPRPLPPGLLIQIFRSGEEARGEEAGEEVHAGDVEVGEVGAVGFVDVVVAFGELGAGAYEEGGEEVVGV